MSNVQLNEIEFGGVSAGLWHFSGMIFPVGGSVRQFVYGGIVVVLEEVDVVVEVVDVVETVVVLTGIFEFPPAIENPRLYPMAFKRRLTTKPIIRPRIKAVCESEPSDPIAIPIAKVNKIIGMMNP